MLQDSFIDQVVARINGTEEYVFAVLLAEKCYANRKDVSFKNKLFHNLFVKLQILLIQYFL